MKTVSELTNQLKQTLGDNLVSVMLYGSSAVQDQTKHFSNVNLLIVTKVLDQPALKSVVPLVREWTREGHVTPRFFSEKAMTDSTDVFPLEFIDMKASHQLLYGSDLLSSLFVDSVHLQHQLEFELRGKLLQLQQRYIEMEGSNKAVTELMAKSLSSFSTLFKGVLCLIKQPVPQHKKETWAALLPYVQIDQKALETIWGIRHGIPLGKNEDVDSLFSRYIASVQAVIEFVDSNRE